MGKAVKAIVGAVLLVAGLFTFSTVLIKLGATLVLSGLADILAPRPRTPGNPGIQQEYAGGVEPRRIVYGQIRTSGMNVIPPWTSGESNKMLHQVLAVAGHEIDSIPNVYLANTDIPAASIGSITGAQTDGAVTTGDYANVVNIRRYLGTSTQTVDYILTTAFPSAWTSNHRGRGVAYAAIQFAYNAEKYQNGKPPVEFLVKGKKVYDPRLDSTNGGTGTQRYTDSTTWTWSQNPALCLADYLVDNRLGLGDDAATRIDWALVAAAANICDELVNLPGSTTQKRYTCNVVLDCTDRYEDNISTLCTAMLGHCYYRGGKWRMYAGAWAASQFTLTADDFTGEFALTTEIPRREKYNAVRTQILDAAQNYRQTEAPAALNATYETADGERIWKEIQLPACTDKYEAQRASIIVNRLGRAKKTVECEAKMAAFRILPFETGTVTISEIGWTNQTVRCVAWSFNPRGTVRLTLREAYSTEWTDPATTDYTSPASVSSVTPNKFNPSAAQNLTATPIVDGILFAWDLPDVVIPGTTYSIYEYTSATPFASATAIATGLTGTSKTITKADTTTRYYWVVSRGPSGGVGAETPAGDGIPGAALTITTGFRATATPGSRTKVGSTSSLTTLSVTVAPVNGTGPYTYAWTTVSGGTINITSPTAATTTFSATSLADPETRTGVKRCTITDSLSATATVDVPLQFTRDSSLYI